jgi:polyisoprenoid-binding protein YceI
MRICKWFTAGMVLVSSLTNYVQAMEFDFSPLSSLCRIEVNLTTGFGRGNLRGTFAKISGNLNFDPENPQVTKGKIILSSRSLRFGHARVAYDTHSSDWLDSSKHPEIIFQLNSLSECSWHDRELRAIGNGTLQIKGILKEVTLPLSFHYYRDKRRKYEGKKGDLLRLDGLLSLPRSQFGLSPNSQLEVIKEDIQVRISVTGVSDRVRPFLPSKHF